MPIIAEGHIIQLNRTGTGVGHRSTARTPSHIKAMIPNAPKSRAITDICINDTAIPALTWGKGTA